MIVTVTLNPSLDEWVYLPRLRLGALNRASRFVRYAGGKGINVSRALHELGEPTLAIALAGGGDGKMLSALLRRQGIAHRFLGVACGAASAMTPGTELCRRADVLKLLRRVTVTQVA